MPSIQDYYDQLASSYDENRFGHSYGRFVDQQERHLLGRWLQGTPPDEVLDIGCGTGRMLEFAKTGVDLSAPMLAVAQTKYPDRRLIQASCLDLNHHQLGTFRAVTCFHLFMHLDADQITQSLAAIATVVAPGGCLIVDLPSAHRRTWKRRADLPGWHGNTSGSWLDLARWAHPHWRVVARRGILWLPIQRFPRRVRPWLQGLDQLLGRSPLARYSSYHVYRLERTP